MGNSAFYYSPHPDTDKVATQTIGLGETISDLQITPYRVSHDAISIGGRLSRVNRRVGMRVRIINERFTDNELAEKLYTMGDHLERGGAVSFTVDSAKTYAATVSADLTSYYSTGSTSVLRMEAPLFDEYSTTAPAVGDVLLVESIGADGKREEVRVHSYVEATKKLTVTPRLRYNHRNGLIIRHRDFFPALFRPARNNDQALLTHDHRISWTWDSTLEIYSAHVAELWHSGQDAGSSLEDKVSGPVHGSSAGTMTAGGGYDPDADLSSSTGDSGSSMHATHMGGPSGMKSIADVVAMMDKIT